MESSEEDVRNLAKGISKYIFDHAATETRGRLQCNRLAFVYANAEGEEVQGGGLNEDYLGQWIFRHLWEEHQ